MAQLNAATKTELAARVESQLSSRFEEIPISHQAVVSGIAIFDGELETAEAAIIAALPAGPANWLTSKPAVAREILLAVAEKRREVL